MDKDAMQYPDDMNHPWHPDHSLQLLKNADKADVICLSCGKLMKEEEEMYYGCSTCGDFSLHLDCAVLNSAPEQPIGVDRPNIHEHPLTLLPREVTFTCNACGIKGNVSPYICLSCRFMIHIDCINLPRVIRINRHPHRLSHTFSITSMKNLDCGVCREGINGRYGAYSCLLCLDFYVHSRCATRKDVWDGKELEHGPEDETLQNPFIVISEDTIKHFSHDGHELRRITSDYNDDARCYACNLQLLYPRPFYKCFECDFILHETCASSPLETRSPIHQHTLTLLYKDAILFRCDACDHSSNGFRYSCSSSGCNIDFDTKCVSITDPFKYGGHDHALHLLSPDETGPCSACDQNTSQRMMLGCVECKFCLCFACATIPDKIPYEDDAHSLSINYGENFSGECYWCDSCERQVDPHKNFYECSNCETIVHTKCAIGGGFRNLTIGVDSTVGCTKFKMVAIDQVTGPSCSKCGCRKGLSLFESRSGDDDHIDSYSCFDCFDMSSKEAHTDL